MYASSYYFRRFLLMRVPKNHTRNASNHGSPSQTLDSDIDTVTSQARNIRSSKTESCPPLPKAAAYTSLLHSASCGHAYRHAIISAAFILWGACCSRNTIRDLTSWVSDRREATRSAKFDRLEANISSDARSETEKLDAYWLARLTSHLSRSII